MENNVTLPIKEDQVKLEHPILTKDQSSIQQLIVKHTKTNKVDEDVDIKTPIAENDVICIESSDEESDEVEISENLKSPARENYFSCVVCSLSFGENWILESHMADVHFFARTLHVCPGCFAAYPLKGDFLNHLAEHSIPYEDNYVTYTCNYCLLSLSEKSKILDHMEAHFREAKLKMDLAKRTAAESAGKESNQSTEAPLVLTDSHYCKSCSKAVHDMEKHAEVAHGNIPVCSLCTRPIHDLERHLRKFHFVYKPIHKCPACKSLFNFQEEYFIEHLQSVHSLDYCLTYTSYECTYCRHMSDNQTDAELHVEKHLGELGVNENKYDSIHTDVSTTSYSLDTIDKELDKEVKRMKCMKNLMSSMKDDDAKLQRDFEHIQSFIKNAQSDKINNKLSQTVCNIIGNFINPK